MNKHLRDLFFAITILVAVMFGFFANIDFHSNEVPNVAIVMQSAEARSRDVWRAIRDQVRRDYERDVRRNVTRDVQRWRNQQRNIARADGDARFANWYLSDRDLRALRILKRCPVGTETQLFVLNSDIRPIQNMCRQLPEFSYVGLIRDQYNEVLGCTIYRYN